MNRELIYLDYHATTPLDERALEAMKPFLCEHFGNASSPHRMGLTAKNAVEKARKQVADLIGARPKEIVFTSGATESNNLALRGVALKYRDRGRHLIVSQVEHSAVLDPSKQLEREGFEVTYLPVDSHGKIRPEELQKAIRKDTILVSLMHANNEVGTINPIGELGALCRSRGILFHTDAAQSVGYLPVDVNAMSIDLLSLSGHKMYGPKGIGALFVRATEPKVELDPQQRGGGQERNLRSGTLNVPAIVGLGAAAEIVQQQREEFTPKLRELRDRLWKGLKKAIPAAELNGHPTERLPNHLSVYLPEESEMLMLGAPHLCFSGGSACHSSHTSASHVALAMGFDAERAAHCIRLGVGRNTTEAEIDSVVECLSRACCKSHLKSGT